MSSGSFDVGLSRLELTGLVKRLAIAEPAMRKALPANLRKAAAPVVQQAKANAAAISPNIKIGTRVRLVGRNGASIKIIGSSPKKPAIAGLLERGNKGGSKTIRHPVFGQQKVWVEQPTQPYLQPALDAKGKEAIAGTSEAITQVLLAMKFL